MRRIVKCDPDLLSLLQQCDSSEVDYLVDVLTDNAAGRVALPSAIKDLLLEEKSVGTYTEDGLRHLLHEFQSYGGNSVVNLFRKEPLPYTELLNDVHKKLNGKNTSEKSTEIKEREIVLGLLGDDWLSMHCHDRWERCTEKRVVTGFVNIEDGLPVSTSNSIKGVITAAALVGARFVPPLAIASAVPTALQSLAEAYRITIPFVVQIARIKMIASAAE